MKLPYQRPSTFQDNQDYFLREHDAENKPLHFSRVTFLAYDPCPAFIIVRIKDNSFRCSRDDLFTVESEPH